jgi:hypothetical protein
LYFSSKFKIRSWVSIVVLLGAGIATSWTATVRFPVEAREFSLLRRVQTYSGAHPASYPMGTGGSFPGVKRLGSKNDRSPLPGVEVMNGGAIPPLPDTS